MLRLQDIPWTAVCLECGYSLRGLGHHQCPECGRAFDPADTRTYSRLGIVTYTRKLYRGEIVVGVFLLLFIGFLMFGVAGFYLL
jgi:ribosomal protein L32